MSRIFIEEAMFCHWLDGYLDYETDLSPTALKKVRDRLNEVLTKQVRCGGTDSKPGYIYVDGEWWQKMEGQDV